MFNTHSTEPLFRYQCRIQGCSHRFTSGSSFSSFKSHASRKHPSWQKYVDQEFAYGNRSNSPSSECHLDVNTDDMYMCTDPEDQEQEMDTTPPCDVDVPTAKRTAGLFLLTFKEKFRLSQRAINYAVGSITTIVDRVCESIQQSVTSELREKGFLDDIAESFSYDDPFAEFQTEYRQTQYYRSEFGLVVSICTL